MRGRRVSTVARAKSGLKPFRQSHAAETSEVSTVARAKSGLKPEWHALLKQYLVNVSTVARAKSGLKQSSMNSNAGDLSTSQPLPALSRD